MRDRLTETLKNAQGVDYADIRLEDLTNTWVNFRGPDLDTIGSARTVSGIVRALYKGGWGYVTFNDLADLPKHVQEACETARLIGTGTTYIAPIEPVVDEVKYDLDTAGRAGVHPTGHGSIRSLTNLVFQPGDIPYETMIRNTPSGLLVHEYLGLE